MAIEMRCPGCGTRSFYSRLREPDDSLRCGTCNHEFEFRQFRETACRSHRDELLHACPELARVFDTYLVSEASDGGVPAAAGRFDEVEHPQQHAHKRSSH
jgi:DNA-directed RNA polymerase subunit RPC12/RpoP